MIVIIIIIALCGFKGIVLLPINCVLEELLIALTVVLE